MENSRREVGLYRFRQPGARFRETFMKGLPDCGHCAFRIGHRIGDVHSPKVSMPVCESLLDLADATERELGDMNPADRIDIQSFI